MNDIADIMASLQGKTIQSVAVCVVDKYNRYGKKPIPKGHAGISNMTFQFTDGTKYEVSTEITFHGNEEHAAEAVVTIDPI